MHAGERSVVGCHAVILQVGDGVHPLLWHVVLGEHNGELFGAVVAVVEEDNHIAGLYGAVDGGVVDRLDELVGHVVVIALLHGGNHVGGLFALAFHKQVVGFLYAVPAFVAVHCVVAADDGCNLAGGFVAVLCELLYEAFARTGGRCHGRP